MPLYLTQFSKNHPLLWRFGTHFVMCMGLNVACALVVTYVVHSNDRFIPNLVYSMCIGSLAMTMIDGLRLAVWRERHPPMLAMLAIVAVAAPTAYGAGVTLGARLLKDGPISLAVAFSGTNSNMLILTVLASLFGVWFVMSRSRMLKLQAEAAAEKERATVIEKQAIQAQLQLLQAQIEPHMLFNTLANLQGMIAMDPVRAQHMLDQLITYLRATLRSSRAGQTTLGQEFSLMEAYLGLMSVRMGKRLSFALDLPAALAAHAVPPMLLQPLIENAIRHGLEPKVDGGHIRVSAEVRGPELLLCVADTGLGMNGAPEPALTAGTNLGVANVRERLAALYGPLAALTLKPNTPQGVVAELTLPYSS